MSGSIADGMWRVLSQSKFGARSTKCLAKRHNHPSALEASVCDLLSAREQAGEIFDTKCQQRVELVCSCGKSTGITWRLDFSFTDKDGNVSFAEAKGFPTEDYKLKLKLWRHGFGSGPLEVWTGNYRKPMLSETVNNNCVVKGSTYQSELEK